MIELKEKPAEKYWYHQLICIIHVTPDMGTKQQDKCEERTYRCIQEIIRSGTHQWLFPLLNVEHLSGPVVGRVSFHDAQQQQG